MAPDSKDGDRRRRFSRISFHRKAELSFGSTATTCELLDLSLKGALVSPPKELAAKVGQPCRLLIRLDPLGQTTIRMDGEVAHVAPGRLGFRCDDIDLESIEHLRRFVELNVGDEEVLHRELGALVAERDW
jgi:hypothetical protein